MQKITPNLWFNKEAREAAEFYVSMFPGSSIKNTTTLENTPSGTVDIVTMEILGMEFMLISAGPIFTFTPAISFIVHCDTQQEIDAYWEKLSADPNAEQCGWLKDRFGVSWQIVPRIMGEMMNDKDPKRRARVTEAFLKMKKFDIETVKHAYEGS